MGGDIVFTVSVEDVEGVDRHGGQFPLHTCEFRGARAVASACLCVYVCVCSACELLRMFQLKAGL